MRKLFRRGETPAALVDDLLLEIAKVQALAAAEPGVDATAGGTAASDPEPAGLESAGRSSSMRRTLNRRLFRWRIRTARAVGLS